MSSSSGGDIIDKRGTVDAKYDQDDVDNRFVKLQRSDAFDIREELSSDLVEIRDAARNIANILVCPINKVVEAGGDAIDGAYDALTNGVDALSIGAWNVFGRVWEDMTYEEGGEEVSEE
jgi:hypothetical protein